MYNNHEIQYITDHHSIVSNIKKNPIYGASDSELPSELDTIVVRATIPPESAQYLSPINNYTFSGLLLSGYSGTPLYIPGVTEYVNFIDEIVVTFNASIDSLSSSDLDTLFGIVGGSVAYAGSIISDYNKPVGRALEGIGIAITLVRPTIRLITGDEDNGGGRNSGPGDNDGGPGTHEPLLGGLFDEPYDPASLTNNDTAYAGSIYASNEAYDYNNNNDILINSIIMA